MTAASHGAYRVPWAPVAYAVGIAAALALDAIFPLGWIEGPAADILYASGWLLVLASIGLAAATVRALRRAKTTVAPHRPSEHLVTSGPFSFTRNPIYLSGAALMIGCGLILGSVWFILFAVVAGLAIQKLAIEPEEKHLFERFGKRYRDYTKRVRRWI
ncbi:MAG: isoprenylcysteine carboxylmethyltransferase family protein [Rhizobiaceae bacterium]|nr:isoprenylcysteine carboxylmethyltransferase family protein [Rhizobiaceae bacterium]